MNNQLIFEYAPEIIPGALILYLNASSLKKRTCRRAYGLTVNGYIGDRGDTTQMDLGSAMHKYAEVYSRTAGEHDVAVVETLKRWPKVDRATILRASSRRADVVIPTAIMVDGAPLIEAKFSVPWMSTIYNGVLIQIVLCGTMDHLGYADNGVRLIDYKSTSYAMVKYAIDKYVHETQFKFYMWVLYRFGAGMLPLEYYNMVREGRFSMQTCIIQVAAKEPRWALDTKRYMSEHQYQMYEHALRAELPQMVEDFANANDEDINANLPPPVGMLNNSCQYCGYKSFCHAKTEDEAYTAFQSFELTTYNPIAEKE